MNPLYKLAFCLIEKDQTKRRKKKEASQTPWLDLARSQLGEKEIPGKSDNPRIVEYHQATSLKATDDETPWCSSFVCWCLEKSGIRSTRSASARSHLKFGYGVKLSEAKEGDVVVFRRGSSSWQGHVGFYVGRSNGFIDVLGGNQSNRVSVARYSESKLLGVRRVRL